MSRFRFVSEHSGTYGVKRLCSVLGVSRSGYYAWCHRGPSAHAERDLELAAVVCEVHSRSRRTYGAPRVHAELGRLGHRTGRKRVARLMREYGLVGAHSRKKWRTGRPNTAWAPDLVERDFNPAGRDRVWAADVTQFRTEEGWLHFAGVIDLYSRRVIGWAMGTSPDADLVIDALVMAFERRRPDQRPIHHADRGAAYTSLAFGQQLERLGDRRVVRIDRRRVRQRRCRVDLVSSQARTRMDPRPAHLANAGLAALGDLRLRRGLLQHHPNQATARLPFTRRVRTRGNRLNTVSTGPGQVHGAWAMSLRSRGTHRGAAARCWCI